MAKYSDKTTRWEHLLSSLTVNAQDLLSLTEAERTELEHLLSRAKQLEAQQDVLRAQSSEIARERKEVDLKGEELAGAWIRSSEASTARRATSSRSSDSCPADRHAASRSRRASPYRPPHRPP